MARIKKNKSIDVQKFGGNESLGETELHGHQHEVESVEAQSKTTLEMDQGTGKPIIMRSFTFKADKKVFEIAPPTKQELFNAHARGLEMSLWRDGLVFEQLHEPHILFNKNYTSYTIFVVATPANGQTVLEKPQTLSEITNG